MTSARRSASSPRPTSGVIPFLAAMDDPALFAPWFTPGDSWAAWRVFVKALFAEAMTPAEAEVFTRHTGRTTPPTVLAREAWVAAGRRAGKSLIAAVLAVYAATCRDYRPHLKPGERAYVLVMAADKDQAGVVLDYIAGFFDHIPMLAGLLEPRGRGKESIRLTNRVTIRVQVASFRRLRGRTVACAILDECAYWYSDEESSNPDTEVLKALRPSLLTLPGALLLAVSTPYARKGILWDAVKRHYGKDDSRVLVWRGDTGSMNPSADRALIAEAYEDDPVAAAAEYGGQFRTDVESFVSLEAVERAVVKGRTFLPAKLGVHHVAFVDPAGGSGGDSMTLAVARLDGDRAVLCRLAEWKPPFSPDTATAEAASVLREYGIRHVVGDHFGGDWPAERFKAHGIRYVRADRTKSDLYLALLPMLNAGVADVVGGPWPGRARAAALALSGDDDVDMSSTGVLLLNDIRERFVRMPDNKVSSQGLVTWLVHLPDRPWGKWGKKGDAITPAEVAALLRPFGIRPQMIRFRPKPANTERGYRRDWFTDAFDRWLPPLGQDEADVERHEVLQGQNRRNPVTHDEGALQHPENTAEILGYGVTPKTRVTGHVSRQPVSLVRQPVAWADLVTANGAERSRRQPVALDDLDRGSA